ncbi:MAG: hypothetical protein JWN72_110 [Thermoleophilia bacterium]|nr:hypothetical protein [Thermoleophilia bacterium]
MGRRRPTDFIAWSLYRRAWLIPGLALLVLLVTSFASQPPVQGTLPPTLGNEQATNLLEARDEFVAQFPDRRPNTSGANDSAQWMRDQFNTLPDVSAVTVPTTSMNPETGKSVSLVNVEARLPGRTRELVVIVAHRDSATASGRGSDATDQLALLALAKELSATRDRRRSYLFVSTDGATLNGGGARALGQRLAKRGGVVAVIVLDRLGAGGELRVDASPSGHYAPPLGLVEAARQALGSEGGSAAAPGVFAQVGQLAAPITLREHGQLLTQGLPALTITAGDDQLADNGDSRATAARVGAGLRSTQRVISTLDQVDQLQSAGKTWVGTSSRIYRGWALKLFIASLLVPVWVVVVDMLMRHRAGWNLLATGGTIARVMIAGIWSVAALWVLTAMGLFPTAGDRPPNPSSFGDIRIAGLICWGLLTYGGWLVARGPDWRRQRFASRAAATSDRDHAELVGGLFTLVVLAALALAISPFAVLFWAPMLHGWIWLCSRRVHSSRARAGVWLLGFGGVVGALGVLAARTDVGLGTVRFAAQLLQTRSVPPLLVLVLGAAAGVAVLMLVAVTGRVAHPALPHLLGYLRGDMRTLRSIRGQLVTGAARQLGRVRSAAGHAPLRLPARRPSSTRELPTAANPSAQPSRTARPATRTAAPVESRAQQRERERLEREARRAARDRSTTR